MKTTKQKILTILSLLLSVAGLVLSLMGIFRGTIAKKQLAKKIETASAEAVEYVRGKYGFEPELLDMIGDELCEDLNKNLYYGAAIKMKANDREFYVIADCDEESSEFTEFSDSYQWQEISAEIVSEIEKILPGGRVIELSAEKKSGKFVAIRYMFTEYFDGENFDKIMENASGFAEIAFSNVEIFKSGLGDKLQSWGMRYRLTALDTSEVAEEFAERAHEYNKTYNAYYLFTTPVYDTYAPYITEAVQYQYKDTEENKVDYETAQFGDFRYAISRPGIDTAGTYVGSGVSVIDRDKFTRYFKNYNEELVSKPLSEAYKISSCMEGCVFYPLEWFEGIDINNVGAVWYDDRTGISDNRGIVKAEICGEYAVFTLQGDEFMLVDISGQGV